MSKAKYTKRDFQLAYRWMFGATLKKGAEVWKKWKDVDNGIIEEVVNAYRNNFRNSFYTD